VLRVCYARDGGLGTVASATSRRGLLTTPTVKQALINSCDIYQCVKFELFNDLERKSKREDIQTHYEVFMLN